MKGTMTIAEAERILDIVSVALQDTSHRHHPISSLKGYDIYQIWAAIKLRIASEFLLLAHRDDSDKQFTDGLNLYDGMLWIVATTFVADDAVDDRFAEAVFNPIDPSTMDLKDEQFASLETVSSFGDYCKSIGSEDPLYWQKIYTRIGLEYTLSSPRGNIDAIAELLDEPNHPNHASAVGISRDWSIGIIGVSVLAIAMLAYVLFDSPPYAFYPILKWAVALASVLCAWALFTRSKRSLPLSVCLALIGAVHLFAGMRKSQWVLFNWIALLSLVLAVAILLIALRRDATPNGSV